MTFSAPSNARFEHDGFYMTAIFRLCTKTFDSSNVRLFSLRLLFYFLQEYAKADLFPLRDFSSTKLAVYLNF
jgi:hypothetical protein